MWAFVFACAWVRACICACVRQGRIYCLSNKLVFTLFFSFSIFVMYRVFHVKAPIKKRHISASRKERVNLKTVSERSLPPILLCKIS